jgi:hypothetical protein
LKRRLMMSIDSGVEGGWAAWDITTPEKKAKLCPPLRWGQILPSEEMPWALRVDDFCNQLQSVVAHLCEVPGTLVAQYLVEFPAYFESEGGRGAAVQGSLVKLAYAVGAIGRTCYQMCGKLELVEVNKWKGQLDKPQVIHRIKRRLPRFECKGHAWDAVGIGLWKKGHFG